MNSEDDPNCPMECDARELKDDSENTTINVSLQFPAMSFTAAVQRQMAINDFNNGILIAAFGSATVPVAVVFVLFSTPNMRRHPIFWIQSAALTFAIIASLLEVSSYGIDTDSQSNKLGTYLNLQLAKEVFKWLVPPLTDTALIFRLLAFYPDTLHSQQKRAAIVAFPVLIKVPRLVAIIINLTYACKSYLSPTLISWTKTLKFQLMEVSLQILDNSYVSTFLLIRSYRFSHASSHLSICSSQTQRRARLLIESITMSFVPAIFTQIVLATLLLVPIARHDLLLFANEGACFFASNIYLSLMFSLLATSWSSICNTSSATLITSRSSKKLRYDVTRTHSDSTESHQERNVDTLADPKKNDGGFEKSLTKKRNSANGTGDISKGQNRTLLHYLTQNEEMERYADAFYFVNDDSQYRSTCNEKFYNY